MVDGSFCRGTDIVNADIGPGGQSVGQAAQF